MLFKHGDRIRIARVPFSTWNGKTGIVDDYHGDSGQVVPVVRVLIDGNKSHNLFYEKDLELIEPDLAQDDFIGALEARKAELVKELKEVKVTLRVLRGLTDKK